MSLPKFTIYQIVTYFLSGFVVVLSGYIFLFPHPCGVMCEFQNTSGTLISLIFVVSCIVGVTINAFRNTFIEVFLFEKRWFKEKNIDWNYFHRAKQEEVEILVSHYYTFYCASFNLSFSLIVAGIIFIFRTYSPSSIPFIHTVCFSVLFLILVFVVGLVLFLYAFYPLRRQIIRQTNSYIKCFSDNDFGNNYNFRTELIWKGIILYTFVTLILWLFSIGLHKHSCHKRHYRKEKCHHDKLVRQPILESIGDFGFFMPGDTLFEQTADTIAQIRNFKQRVDGKNYQVIYLYGGVDKRPLIHQVEKKFGDNLTLAQARAERIQHLIQNLVEKDVVMIAQPVGAVYCSSDSNKMEQDRAVKVYGLKW